MVAHTGKPDPYRLVYKFNGMSALGETLIKLEPFINGVFEFYIVFHKGHGKFDREFFF